MLKAVLIKSYKNGFFHLLSANAFIQLVAFASQLFVAGILSPDDIGRIKIIQTYLAIFSVLASLGFNSSTLKFCSENRPKEEQISLFKSALFLTLISSVTLYFILVILNKLHIFSIDKVFIILFPIGIFPIITSSIFLIFIAYFQATGKIKLLSKHTTLNKLLSISAIIAFTYWIGIKGYYYAYNISSIFIILFCLWEFRAILKTRNSLKKMGDDFFILWPYAIKSMISLIISESSAFIDIILISFFIPDLKEIGYYGFALTMIVIFRLIPSTVQQITIPYFSNIGTDKISHKSLYEKYNKTTTFLIFGTLILALLFVPIFTHHIFNSKYDKSMSYFPFLAIGWSFRVLSVFPNGVIFAIGKVKYNINTSIITLAFNTISLIIALHFYGLIGAAIVSIPTGIVNFISSQYFYKKSYSETF